MKHRVQIEPRAVEPAGPASRLFGELRALSARKASGEFIAASRSCEVHLFLHQGRVAWGSSTKHRRAFRTHLEQTCGVTPSEFDEIIDACRRERVPLDETLVRLKLASADQVSGALRQQIGEAIAVLRELGDVPVVFLSREEAWGESPRRSFALDEFLAPPPGPAPARAERLTLDEARRLTTELRRSLREFECIAVTEADALLHAEPPTRGTDAPALHRATVALGAHFVLVRDERRTVVGVAVDAAGQTSLWGELSANVSLSEAQAAFARVGRAPPTEGLPPTGLARRDGPGDPAFDRVAEALLHDAAIWAVLLVGGDGARCPTLARADVSLPALAPALAARTALLLGRTAGAMSDDSVVAIADGGSWCFGAPIREAALWIVARPSLPMGLGIALLRSTVKRLAGDRPRPSAITLAPDTAAPAGATPQG